MRCPRLRLEYEALGAKYERQMARRDGPNHKPSIVYCWAPLDCGPRRLETALRVGVPVMTSTLAFSLIAAFLMLGVIADSWGRRFRR